MYDVLQTVFKAYKPSHVTIGWNEDNTPFSLSRDQIIQKHLRKSYTSKQVSFYTNPHDVTIVPVRDIRTDAGAKYQKFTPFYKKALAKGVIKPQQLPKTMFLVPTTWDRSLKRIAVSSLWKHKLFKHLVKIRSCVCGGRTEGLKRLTVPYIKSRCVKYDTERNHTWAEKTTRLSAYFKFGCVSFREAYNAVQKALKGNPKACEALTREFFWNAFYSYVSYCFPHVLSAQLNGITKTKKKRINLEMQEKLQNKMKTFWKTSDERLQRWKDGNTGFPYIDAAMRQLKTTGWMHNRARMVVASFLIKNLRLDWREGEKHFAKHLVDYDPSANNGGWQWAASTGADSLQFTRIFNPWTQSKTYDPQVVYIRRYVKEFADTKIPAKDIHQWHNASIREKYNTHPQLSTYSSPIIDHTQSRKETLTWWKHK